MLLLALLLAAATPLGGELRVEGFALRPPSGFATMPLDFFQGTRAGAVGGGTLAAALTDGAGPEAAALLVAVADGSFDAHPGARDEFSGAVVRHFRDELSMPFTLESAQAVPGPAPRIEVLGTIQQEGATRNLLVAAMAGEGRHGILTWSMPSGRYQALKGSIAASMDSFRAPPPAGWPRGLASGLAGALVGALLVGAMLIRRRRPIESEGTAAPRESDTR